MRAAEKFKRTSFSSERQHISPLNLASEKLVRKTLVKILIVTVALTPSAAQDEHEEVTEREVISTTSSPVLFSFSLYFIINK